MQARLMGQALRKLSHLGKFKHAPVHQSDARKGRRDVGSPETTLGGKALKFYSSVRIDIRRREQLKDNTGNVVGNHVRAKVVKNKASPPFTEAEFDIMYGQGINWEGDLIAVGLAQRDPKEGRLAGRRRDDRPGQGSLPPCAGGRQGAGRTHLLRDHRWQTGVD